MAGENGWRVVLFFHADLSGCIFLLGFLTCISCSVWFF